jgi:hypothetical protein
VPEVDQPTDAYPPKYRIVLPEATMLQINTHAKIRVSGLCKRRRSKRYFTLPVFLSHAFPWLLVQEALLEAASLEVEIKKGQAQVKALREALICKGGKALDEEMKSALSNEEQRCGRTSGSIGHNAGLTREDY